jgi:hypothetical protein
LKARIHVPKDFVIQYLSRSAGKAYTECARLFPGASWVATPVTDKKAGKDVGTWWEERYAHVIELLDNSNTAAVALKDASPGAAIGLALRELFEPEKYPEDGRVTAADLCAVVANRLVVLQTGLDRACVVQRDKPGLGAALRELRDAAFSVGMASIAKAENTARREPFSETFNQLFLRDRAAALYEMVGDPPAGYEYGAKDTPYGYTRFAVASLSLTLAPKSGDVAVPSTLTRLTEAYEQSQQMLRGKLDPKPRKVAERHRREAISSLGNLADLLGKATERLSVSGHNDATDAVALSAVFTESMSGLLGLPPRGKDKLTSAPPVGAMIAFARGKVGDIKAEADSRKDSKDPNYDPSDPGEFGEVRAVAV